MPTEISTLSDASGIAAETGVSQVTEQFLTPSRGNRSERNATLIDLSVTVIIDAVAADLKGAGISAWVVIFAVTETRSRVGVCVDEALINSRSKVRSREWEQEEQ